MRVLPSLLFCSAGLAGIAYGSLAVKAEAGRQKQSETPALWVGAERCGACHENVLKRWQGGPHASAARSLGPQAGSGRCESCHGTGDAPAGRSYLKNVQCEACHGAGLHYSSEDVMRDPVLAKALGLREIATSEQRKALCLRCHQETTSIRAFDVEKAWRRIGH